MVNSVAAAAEGVIGAQTMVTVAMAGSLVVAAAAVAQAAVLAESVVVVEPMPAMAAMLYRLPVAVAEAAPDLAAPYLRKTALSSVQMFR